MSESKEKCRGNSSMQGTEEPVDDQQIEPSSNRIGSRVTFPVTGLKSYFPEGLRAWSTVLGSFFLQVCGFGYTTAFGVFQDYYVRVYMTNESASTIAWIGSINGFFIVGLGLPVGYIYDRGYFYALLWGGSFLMAFSLFMLPLTQPNHFYQNLLCQGFGAGIASGLLYVPSFAIISQYFHDQHRRSIAMTTIAGGSPLGAVVHTISLNTLISRVGFRVATLANAGLISGLLLISCLLIHTEVPPSRSSPNSTNHTSGKTHFLRLLKKFAKDKAYICCSLGFFFFIVAFYFPLYYLQLDAIKHGMSENFAFYVLVILSGSAFVGRLLSGFLVHPLGLETLAIISTACCGLLTISMAGISNGNIASVVVIAVLNGFFGGIFIASMAPLVANLADDVSEIGLRMGIAFTLDGFAGLVGPPISGALITRDYHWWRGALFTGLMSLVASGLFVAMVFFQKRKSKVATSVNSDHPSIIGDSTP